MEVLREFESHTLRQISDQIRSKMRMTKQNATFVAFCFFGWFKALPISMTSRQSPLANLSHLSHPKYRPDIDGLRAIAILSVVAFHAFPGFMKGGFIGVDIFFVISGYLISTIIFENLEQDTFNLSEFYIRRIKRILPALILVLVSCFIFGWNVLFADEFKQLGKHILAGASFVSNIVLWKEVGYFDNTAESKPLLHLWSLGIEEQFYIIWPLLLWFAWRRNFNLLIITIFVATVSFALNVYGLKQDAVATFYSPQTRFWELLSGSLLAWVTLYRNRKKQIVDNNMLPHALSFSGLFLLAYGLWRINKDLSFPGIWALIPVIGAVLIISAGPKAWPNRTILSSKPFVWLGLISFPLYLWHWPLLSFARVIESQTPDKNIRMATVLLSIMLAWLTYKFVELPIRFGKPIKAKVSSLIVLLLLVGLAGYNIYSRDGLKFREMIKNNISLTSGEDGGDGGHMIKKCGIQEESVRKIFQVCAEDKRGNVRFALMGDSKADAMYPGLVRTSSPEGHWLVIGGFGPNGAPTPLLDSDLDPNHRLTVLAVDAIVKNKAIDTVVLVTAIRSIFLLSDDVKSGNRATYNYTYLKKLNATTRFDIGYEEMNRVINKFVAVGKKVVLVVDNPALPNPEDCMNRRTSITLVNKVLGKVNQDCYVPLDVFNAEIKIYRQLLAKLQASHPDSVEIFDPTDIYCNKDRRICEPVKNGRFMYSYTDHISDYASGLVGRRLNEFLVKK